MRLHLILGLAISVACLVFLLRGVDLPRLWELIRQVNLLYYLMVTALLALSYYVRSLRWRLLLKPLKDCSLSALFSANLIGFMANNILPARLGELVRAYAANRLAQVPTSSALATLVIERVLDGMTLLVLLFAALLFADPKAQAGAFNVAYLRGAGLVLLAGYLGVLAVMVALYRWPQATTGWLAGLAGRFSPRLGNWVQEVLVHFTAGLAMLSQTRHLPLLLLQSALLWALSLVMAYLFLPAVGLPLSLLMAAMVMAGGSLAAAVPSGPGYVGTIQLAMLWALMLAGAGEDRATAYAVVFWAASYFPMTIAGLLEMARRGLSLGSLRQKAEEAAGD
ncbi:MAG: lysylphosphatidylglycerol synthase transmembrane domain-containing protein [Thermodesulfobacteriota bacterium]